MNARDQMTVEQALDGAQGLLTTDEIERATGLDEKTVRTELKRIAGLGNLEHVPGRGRGVKSRYGLIARLNPAGESHSSAPCSAPTGPESCSEARAETLRADPAEQNWMGLQGVVEGIRAAIPGGERLMLGEIAAAVHTYFLRSQRVEHLERESSRLVGEHEDLARQFAVLKERHDSYEQAIAEIHRACSDAGVPEGHVATRAHKLAETVATLRQAAHALADDPPVDVTEAAAGYLIRVPKRRPRTLIKSETARAAALAAARSAGRADVFALVPVGRAVRGAEWKEA